MAEKLSNITIQNILFQRARQFYTQGTESDVTYSLYQKPMLSRLAKNFRAQGCLNGTCEFYLFWEDFREKGVGKGQHVRPHRSQPHPRLQSGRVKSEHSEQATRDSYRGVVSFMAKVWTGRF